MRNHSDWPLILVIRVQKENLVEQSLAFQILLKHFEQFVAFGWLNHQDGLMTVWKLAFYLFLSLANSDIGFGLLSSGTIFLSFLTIDFKLFQGCFVVALSSDFINLLPLNFLQLVLLANNVE